MRKSDMGARWFISQAIYNSAATIALLNDYGTLCRRRGVPPCKVSRARVRLPLPSRGDDADALPLALPTGRAHVRAVRPREDDALHQVARRRRAGRDRGGDPRRRAPGRGVDRHPHAGAQGDPRRRGRCGVPLGIVESVSIFREEIDAAHNLFRGLQGTLLDALGTPWTVRWLPTAVVDGELGAGELARRRGAGRDQAQAAAARPPAVAPVSSATSRSAPARRSASSSGARSGGAGLERPPGGARARAPRLIARVCRFTTPRCPAARTGPADRRWHGSHRHRTPFLLSPSARRRGVTSTVE